MHRVYDVAEVDCEGFTDFVGPPEDVPEEMEVRIGKQSTLTQLNFFGIVSLYSVVMKRRRSEEG